jgi:predicted aspartyl protease
MKKSTFVLSLWLTMFGVVNVFGASRSQTMFLLPLKLYGEHLIVVQGGLGNLADRNLLVDTGAYPSAIDIDVARKLKLQVKRGESRALGQNIPAGAAIISQVEIGPVQALGLPVVVEDLSALSAALGIRVDALIGLDVLARASFQIDYSGKELAFGPPVGLTFATPIEAERAMACVSMRISGHLVHLLVDTGAAKTVLFKQRVPWLASSQKAGQSFTSLSGRLVLNEVKASDAELGGIKIDARDVFLSDGANMAGMPFDGIMATWGAHLRKVSFDFEHDIFSWQADGVPAPGPQSPNSVITARAYNGGAAESSGPQEGADSGQSVTGAGTTR